MENKLYSFLKGSTDLNPTEMNMVDVVMSFWAQCYKTFLVIFYKHL